VKRVYLRGDVDEVTKLADYQLKVEGAIYSITKARRTTLKGGLVAASLDNNSSFLLKGETNYCGGPKLSSSAALSKRCNISQTRWAARFGT
jgi:hypothetical protein